MRFPWLIATKDNGCKPSMTHSSSQKELGTCRGRSVLAASSKREKSTNMDAHGSLNLPCAEANMSVGSVDPGGKGESVLLGILMQHPQHKKTVEPKQPNVQAQLYLHFPASCLSHGLTTASLSFSAVQCSCLGESC